MKRYSVDKLLKKKPKKLKELKFRDNGSGDLYVEINKVLIFANNYKIIYSEQYVVLRFFNGKTLAATVSVYGSSEFKKDEAFIVDGYSIISETSYRVMKSDINDIKKNKNKYQF